VGVRLVRGCVMVAILTPWVVGQSLIQRQWSALRGQQSNPGNRG
jgi:hypothetical protein